MSSWISGYQNGHSTIWMILMKTPFQDKDWVIKTWILRVRMLRMKYHSRMNIASYFWTHLKRIGWQKRIIIFELRKSSGAGGGGAHRREQEQAEKKTKHFEIKISLKQNNQSNETKTIIRRAGSKTGCRRSLGSWFSPEFFSADSPPSIID